MGTPFTRADAELLFTSGELATLTDMQRIQHLAGVGIMGLLAGRLLFDEANNGFKDGFFGDDCKVSTTGALGYIVAIGMGFMFDSSVADAFASQYRPIVLGTASTGSFAARDATNPRHDIVCIAPATVDDTAETVSVKDPSSGAMSSTSINRRRRYSATVSVVTGTAAASPVDPATPSGSIKIVSVLVPPAGALTFTDTRQRLQLGAGVSTIPPHSYHQNFVLGTGAELQVTPSGTPSMVLQVAAGSADVNGAGQDSGSTRVQIRQASTVTVSAADPTNPRIDIVVLRDTGVLSVVAGTPAGSPVAPSTPSASILLAQVAVAALATALDASTITDYRQRLPLTASRTAGIVRMASTVGAEAANVINVSLQAKDQGSNIVLGVTTVRLELIKAVSTPIDAADYYIAAPSVGSLLAPTHPPAVTALAYSGGIYQTDANGVLTFDVHDVVGGANHGIWLIVTPMRTPGECNYIDLGFN